MANPTIPQATIPPYPSVSIARQTVNLTESFNLLKNPIRSDWDQIDGTATDEWMSCIATANPVLCIAALIIVPDDGGVNMHMQVHSGITPPTNYRTLNPGDIFEFKAGPGTCFSLSGIFVKVAAGTRPYYVMFQSIGQVVKGTYGV